MERNNLKSSPFKIVIMLILGSAMLFVAVIAVLFSFFGNDIYLDFKADDMLPRAEALAKELSEDLTRVADPFGEQVKSSAYAEGDHIVYIFGIGGAPVGDGSLTPPESVINCSASVLHGETVSSPHTRAGVVVGAPIKDNAGSTVGAVMLLHCSSVARAKVDTLSLKFVLVALLILALVSIPAVLIVHSITKPIKIISNTALEMAKGDLSVRAKVDKGVTSQHLAESFNTLADALESNVESLMVERNRMSAVINGIGEGIIAVDKNGDIMQFNPSSVQLLGGENSVEHSPSDLPLYEKIDEVVRRVLQSDMQVHTYVKHNDRVLNATVTPIHEDNGSLCGAVVMLRDITESERLEQTRKDYVANVSHELRTPLASIRSLSDALNDGLITDEDDKKRYYGYIQHESIRLSNLIDDLLELSRLQSGGVAFTKGRVNLYEIVYDVADVMNESALSRGKQVRLLVNEGEYLSSTNSGRVEQVLIALVDNAIKHGLDGCKVDIDLAINEKENKYVFCISNPAEIDEADLEHIFERFYKADRAHSGEGTGLGLAIVAEVLKLLDERIFFDYDQGVIRFLFTVERFASDSEHPDLAGKGIALSGNIREYDAIKQVSSETEHGNDRV